MAKVKTVWGIDIGQTALKALELRNVNGRLQVETLDIIEHPQILSQPDANARELVRSALEQFLSRNNVVGSTVCISVPGQSSFTRFVKLPPVEPRKIPDIVRFEAEQQIPFPIADVIWRWQTFRDPDSPDVEVGIFAMKRSDIDETLSHFTDVQMDVDVVQMAPLALYNFMMYDGQVAENGASLLADIGAEKTDLVVADGPRIWTRTIQIGGNNFTEALVKAFKLSFPKAEKLKRTAASSKYARQIFQAMRPVFADLVQEIQRSVGYYTSLHRETRFKRLVGLGNGFRLPGLQKFLEQNLSIPVVRVDSYKNLQPSSSVNAAIFAENVLSFAVAYGMAAQGLEEAVVSTNLLPIQITRARQWTRKRPWFAVAAALLLVAMGVKLFRDYSDNSALRTGQAELRKASRIASELQSLKSQHGSQVSKGRQVINQVHQVFGLYRYRDYWPGLQHLILRGIEEKAPHQRLLAEYANADTEERQKEVLTRIKNIPRNKRLMIFIEEMETIYKPDVLDAAQLGLRDDAGGGAVPRRGGRSKRPDSKDQSKRGYLIYITGRTPLPMETAVPFLRGLCEHWESLGEKVGGEEPLFSVVDCQVKDYLDRDEVRPSKVGAKGKRSKRAMKYGAFEEEFAMAGEKPGASETAKIEDPLFPGDPSEDQADDTRFVIALVVSIEEPADVAGS